MGGENGELRWYSPDPRGIIPLDDFHVPARLARVIRQGRFEIAVNRAFGEVIAACAIGRRDGNWITDEIVSSYTELHRLGLAHSVETWQEGRLVGGLYGVSWRGAFFGESMFSRVSNASKVALHALVGRLRGRGYRLLDIQWLTEHLQQFGAVEISRRQYMRLLEEALLVECRFVE